ncbi:MFS transporter [Flavihumibacter solisilvae]|uniref:MFS transporter n=1 Tax=Flavihumibacter solisilvae TaxID=1349421 RepID=A0A0C1LFZ6_9BACT|nr:MFS transporter [Flavihumibacter solisilvae]KIC94273.1 hypothetical protein OI18_11580 [Flavihumibacter solisilvae]
MPQTVYFNDLASRHIGLVRVSLVLILFTAIAQFPVFALIQAHVISFNGAQPEDVSFALQIAYAGIISILPIQFRLVKYFNTRSYLLIVFFAGILLNIGCLFVHDFVLFSILRFLTGIVTCMIAGCMLIVLFTTLPEPKKMIVGISLFFSVVLTSGLIVGIGASRVVSATDWIAIYYGMIGLQVIGILLCVLIFRSRPAIKPYPLYQLDWIGTILFMFGAAAVTFVMIYGPRRYWLADPSIRYAAIFSVLVLILFLYRQATLKRPLIDLGAFRSGKFIFGLLLLLIFFGIKDSINFIYGYSASVLGWSSKDVTNSGLFNIAGVILATFIVVKAMLANKKNLPILLLAGFAVMFIYHVWVYLHLTPDLSLRELYIPIFLQGFASGLLFVPILIFCTVSLPQSTGMTGIIICTYARFIATLNSTAGFYEMQLHFNQLYKESFLGKLAPGNEILSQRQELYKGFLMSKGIYSSDAIGISNIVIAKSTGIQSQLLTIRAIFLVAAIMMAVIFVILVLFAVINKIKASRESVSAK